MMIKKDLFDELAQFDSPTISNAIESFDIRPKTEGFMGPKIRPVLPLEKPMVGYVCTAKISALEPATSQQKALKIDYYRKVKSTPNPTITVIEDSDPEPVGSFWGEVQTSIHRALGCVGAITDGGVRDLDEVKKLGFGYFASCVLVSHAYVHVEDYDCPVEVGGLKVEPGDLLHADKHGVVSIPLEIAEELPEACRHIENAEEPVMKGCQDNFEEGIDVGELRGWLQTMNERRNQRDHVS